MKHTIELKSVQKIIENETVLNNISIKIESGKIYGFVGKNGSGKTMLFRLMAGLIKANEGQLLIDGKEVKFNEEYPLSIGLMIENSGLYKEFTGKENLKLLASIRNKIGNVEIEEAIKKVGLEPNDKRIVKKYSLGMRQRLVFAQAIMEKPDVLLLDEPTNALDKNGVDVIRQLILEEKNRGAIVCLASHNEGDIGMLCDEIYNIERGEIGFEKNN